MAAKPKLSPVAEAYQRSKAGREALLRTCRAMECTEDKCGIVWERFVTRAGVSLILVATPHWWDVYAPVTELGTTSATLDKILELAARQRSDDMHEQLES